MPHGKRLHTVDLQYCDFGHPGQLAAQLGPQQLAQLRQLQLSDCRGLLGMTGVVQALLSSAPRLEGLQFMVTDFGPLGPPNTQHLHSFPTAIFSHPALTRAEVLSMDDERWDAFELPPLPDPRESGRHTGVLQYPPPIAAIHHVSLPGTQAACPQVADMHCCSAACWQLAEPQAHIQIAVPSHDVCYCFFGCRRPGGAACGGFHAAAARPGGRDQPD